MQSSGWTFLVGMLLLQINKSKPQGKAIKRRLLLKCYLSFPGNEFYLLPSTGTTALVQHLVTAYVLFQVGNLISMHSGKNHNYNFYLLELMRAHDADFASMLGNVRLTCSRQIAMRLTKCVF